MSIIRRSITTHISPNLGGLAPETHDFVRYLNKEAKRLRTGVSFIALANRILAHGNIEPALKFANTLGGRLLHRAFHDGFLAHRPPIIVLRGYSLPWRVPTIGGEEDVLRGGNSGHRKKVRRFEKNNLPFKCDCIVCGGRFECRSIKEYVKRQCVCWGCSIENKIKIAAETLYHLVCAIPQMERDREGIYPADFRYWRIALWQEEKERLPGLGLSDYGEPTKLLDKYGRYFSAWRQKAASPVYYIPITPDLANFYLWLWQQLKTPDEQRLLKRIGRLYKNSCWDPTPGPRSLFDRCMATSLEAKARDWAKRREEGWRSAASAQPSWWQYRAKADVEKEDRATTWREIVATQRQGGRVEILGSPVKRHANLANTRAAYNAQHGSYLNSGSLTTKLREARSLNIPRETIELRNNMVANLERDFSPRDQARIA